jgi:hypothetical protein
VPSSPSDRCFRALTVVKRSGATAGRALVFMVLLPAIRSKREEAFVED